MRVYYVQRLNAPRNPTPFDFGGGKINGGISKEAMNIIKTIFSFDYMGSAEFEWGAVPAALDALTKLTLTTFILGKVFVIAPELIKDEVKAWIELAIEDKQGRLKEYLGLKEALSSNQYNKTLGWLKIEDDNRCKEPFMFFIDENMFKATCEIIGVK